ncbi:VOC family protein [Chloroflexota bacterium]
MIKKFTHVGIVVKDINHAIDLYSKAFGFEPGPFGMMEVPEIGVKNFSLIIGRNFIEFMEPTNFDMPIGKFLKERGEGVYHISFSVDDIKEQVNSLRQNGVTVEDPWEVPSIPYQVKVAWVDPKSVNGVNIELVELPSGITPKSA